MADVKNEDTSSVASADYDDQQLDNAKDWNVARELDFLNAVARCKPVGIHKHFRLISIQRQFNQTTQTRYSIQDIRERLSAYYDMDALEELEQEEEEEEEENVEGEADEDTGLHEFTLPLDEYEQLISEHRQEDEAELSASPSPPPAKKSRAIKREASPMSSASATPTPEPEEGKSSRRSTRKKTDTRKRTSGTSKASSTTGTSTATGGRRKRR